MGKAVVLKFTDKSPVDGKGQSIDKEDLRGVEEGDIVLMWSPHGVKGKSLGFGEESPFISVEAAEYLIKKKIKQLGITGVRIDKCHNLILENDIPIIEGLVNLDKIKKKNVFYIGLPLRWQGLDACAIRAIVLEEKDQSIEKSIGNQ